MMEGSDELSSENMWNEPWCLHLCGRQTRIAEISGLTIARITPRCGTSDVFSLCGGVGPGRDFTNWSCLFILAHTELRVNFPKEQCFERPNVQLCNWLEKHSFVKGQHLEMLIIPDSQPKMWGLLNIWSFSLAFATILFDDFAREGRCFFESDNITWWWWHGLPV